MIDFRFRHFMSEDVTNDMNDMNDINHDWETQLNTISNGTTTDEDRYDQNLTFIIVCCDLGLGQKWTR